ncbi:Endonuclease/exonuclease/phosphatase [Macleaya cordata]|uniref:Endonuclease/exonuclease/phosphatase n=1 Tax=Macleaya cordata TaxID=56857 RepID=A0A200PYK3_MACCD|nr:Endonuclease/exonuclease/phosphatase [Macleaya cordata]
MSSHVAQPWVLIGDLNSIFDQSEKKGGNAFKFSDIKDIKYIIDQAGLLDLGYVGPTFTWCNGQLGWARIHERLDRALANSDWTSLSPNATVEHLSPIGSDHAPIFLSTSLSAKSSPKPFRFFNLWLKEDSYLQVVKHAWDQHPLGSSAFQLASGLRIIKNHIKI